MDYIFRWLQIRFLSGQQLEMFARAAGLHTQAVPVAGTIGTSSRVTAPALDQTNAAISTEVSAGHAAERPCLCL